MARNWISNALNAIEHDFLSNATILQKYAYSPIDVEWTIAHAHETHSFYGRDALIITATDANDQVFDVCIPEQFYPRQSHTLDDFIGSTIVGVNPMIEIEHDSQPLLVCKFVKVILKDGGSKINPHASISKYQQHNYASTNGDGSSGDAIVADRTQFIHQPQTCNKKKSRSSRNHSRLTKDVLMQPHKSVDFMWVSN